MPNNAPDIKVEIVSPPSMKDMTISQVGQNMFSVNMNIVAVVRFVIGGQSSMPVVQQDISIESRNTTTAIQPAYSDGTAPQPGGETAAFNDFTGQHGYAPQSREILAEWVKLQQGGA